MVVDHYESRSGKWRVLCIRKGRCVENLTKPPGRLRREAHRNILSVKIRDDVAVCKFS